MPRRLTTTWLPEHSYSLSSRSRRGGTYHPYVPDPLGDLQLRLPPELSREVARVERRIHCLSDRDTASGLEAISRFLLRSEAIASSRIEGIAPGVDKIALAEIAGDDEVRPSSTITELVANNVAILTRIGTELSGADSLTIDTIVSLQAELLRGSAPIGLREEQNWIGGSSYHPLDAEFVPPPPELVPDLMTDLVEYLDGAVHGALVQAALAHAQFETIHPFADGNGRVGRALIHAVLRRRGLLPAPILPVSMVLNTWSDDYMSGLQAFRVEPGGAETPSDGASAWIAVFTRAADAAVDQAQRLADDLGELRSTWDDALAGSRRAAGIEPTVRADSVTAKLLRDLPAMPVVTVRLVRKRYGTTDGPARKAVEALEGAGILRGRAVGKRTRGYFADDVLDLVGTAERRLASTRFDTRLASDPDPA